MTEVEWLGCEDPRPMLEFLDGKASDRKLRLFACACCSVIVHLADGRCRHALSVAEQFADGLVTEAALESARRIAHDVFCEFQGIPEMVSIAVSLTCSPVALQEPSIEVSATVCALAVVGFERPMFKASRILARRRHSRWLRDIFGNPFRAVACDPAWLAWNGGTITTLARAVYEERELPSGHLDQVRLALMADMLEDAGCSDAAILDHLRGPGPYVRGCWVVDLLLRKS